MPMVPMARAIAAAIGTPSMPQRVDSERSATATTCGRARLLEIADDERAEVGQRGLRPVDRRRPVAGLPLAQPDEIEAVAVEQAAMLAGRHLAHPLQDDELDFVELGQVDERLDLLLARPHGMPTRVDDVLDHALGRQAVAGRVRPEPDAMAEDVRRELLDVLRVHLGPAPHEQRPHLREAAPADDGARRRAEIDAALDELGRRVDQPVGVGVVRPRRGHQPLNVDRPAARGETPAR